MDNWI